MLDDAVIRSAFRRTRLRRQSQDPHTLILDELGLQHGNRRADIAVINGLMVGYEIKSDLDSLSRLRRQVPAYNSVFDRAWAVVTERHLRGADQLIPPWWGLIGVSVGPRGGLGFRTYRRARSLAAFSR